MSKTLKFFFLVAALMMTAQSSIADIVQFDNGLRLRDGTLTNSSGTTPYVAGSGVNEIGDLNGAASITETYFWADATTGINFSFDVTYAANVGNVDNTGNGLGISGTGGDNNTVNTNEQLTFTVSNLMADVSGYIDGSVGGISGPVAVTGLGLGIQAVQGQFRVGANQVDFTGPGGTLVSTAPTLNAAAGSIFPEAQLGDSGTFVSVTNATETGNPDPLTDGWRGRTDLVVRAIIDIEPDLVQGPLKGDVNLDGIVTFLDINPFILLLASNGFQAEADCDCDGDLDFLDIQPFIDILAGN